MPFDDVTIDGEVGDALRGITSCAIFAYSMVLKQNAGHVLNNESH